MKRGNHSARSADDTFQALLESVARFIFLAGAGCTVLSAGFLIFYYMKISGEPNTAAAAASNIALFGKILMPATVATAVGACYLFWSEEVLGVLLIIAAVIMGVGPKLLGGDGNAASLAALVPLQTPALVLGLFGFVAVAADMYHRITLRMTLGAKADTIKYGKGVKEERDIQNVFMGKCWQLPYCRKFVREKCPIFHAKVTCWKERVGCMCEEQVIKNAMEGKTVPRDMVAASQYIPRNNKLNAAQKAERCRQCSIYNEHQKHKYKLALPTVLIGMIAIYGTGRETFVKAAGLFLINTQGFMNKATLSSPGTENAITKGTMMPIFQEVLVVVVFLIIIAYLLKMLEYFIFTLKI
ncbi:MAG: hypothetical protein K8R88_09875 [Armatimonadetes bacterium]|nr:hypothetical protein [Armatimonadota bacterium]